MYIWYTVILPEKIYVFEMFHTAHESKEFCLSNDGYNWHDNRWKYKFENWWDIKIDKLRSKQLSKAVDLLGVRDFTERSRSVSMALFLKNKRKEKRKGKRKIKHLTHSFWM